LGGRHAAQKGGDNMHALTIRRPWAGAILTCGKDVENRQWCAPRKCWGKPLLIHAAKGIDAWASWPGTMRPLSSPLDDHAGVLLGYVTLLRCERAEECQLEWCEQSPGAWAWLLAEPRIFPEPLPWRGLPGLFEVPDAAVRSAVRSSLSRVEWEVRAADQHSFAAMQQAQQAGEVVR
jgi:hypothetical protein